MTVEMRLTFRKLFLHKQCLEIDVEEDSAIIGDKLHVPVVLHSLKSRNDV